MYLLIVGHRNGDVSYFGPFPNETRALQYGNSCADAWPDCRWHVKGLINPHSVVESIKYRGK